MIAAPSTSREATLTGVATGLAGTLTAKVINPPAGTVVVAETTSNITEGPTGTYTWVFTTPSSAGQYLIVWDYGGSEDPVEELEVTASGTAAPSYDLSTDVGKVRLEIGDTETDTPEFVDEEITYFLSVEGSVLGAAARACEALAAKFARQYDFQTDDQRFQRSQMSKQYADLASTLRSRAGGVVTTSPTRVDGYSDDIANNEVSTASTGGRGRVRRGWFRQDVPH